MRGVAINRADPASHGGVDDKTSIVVVDLREALGQARLVRLERDREAAGIVGPVVEVRDDRRRVARLATEDQRSLHQ
jgi:hypothetical protein